MKFSGEFVESLYRKGFLLTIILILLDLLTYFFYSDTLFKSIFYITREQTPFTWFSAVLLFIIGLVCLSEYFINDQKIWYFVGLIFLFFSIDDATYFHERFTGNLQDLIPYLDNFISYSWIIIYIPFLLLSFGFVIFHLHKILTKKQKKFLYLAVFLLAVGLALDMIDGVVVSDDTLYFCIEKQCHKSVTHIIRLTEEVFEVYALGIISYLLLKMKCLTNRSTL